MFHDVELADGKFKALFDRVKVRDLYDISDLEKVIDKASKAMRPFFIKRCSIMRRSLHGSLNPSKDTQNGSPTGKTNFETCFFPC